MRNRIIRLVTADNFGKPNPVEKVYDSINVIREEYTEELMAYFIRSKTGALLIVNSTYSIQDQAKAISTIKNEIKKCGIVETGVLLKGFEYRCGGKCCNQETVVI